MRYKVESPNLSVATPFYGGIARIAGNAATEHRRYHMRYSVQLHVPSNRYISLTNYKKVEQVDIKADSAEEAAKMFYNKNLDIINTGDVIVVIDSYIGSYMDQPMYVVCGSGVKSWWTVAAMKKGINKSFMELSVC